MTPVLRDLHWLPVRQRTTFKTAVLKMFKCLHDMAPHYLQTYCKPVSACTDRRHLRSVQSGRLTVQRTSTNYDDRVRGTLPAELRSLDTLDTSRHKLTLADPGLPFRGGNPYPFPSSPPTLPFPSLSPPFLFPSLFLPSSFPPPNPARGSGAAL